MVPQNTLRTFGDNKVFRFVKDIWLHRQSRHIRFFFRKKPILQHSCATCFELPSNIFTMVFVLDGSSEHFAHVSGKQIFSAILDPIMTVLDLSNMPLQIKRYCSLSAHLFHSYSLI